MEGCVQGEVVDKEEGHLKNKRLYHTDYHMSNNFGTNPYKQYNLEYIVVVC